MVELPHICLPRDDTCATCDVSRSFQPFAIVCYSLRGDLHCSVDLVGVSPSQGGCRGASSPR